MKVDRLKKLDWDSLLISLTLIRLGQELGSEGHAAKGVAGMIDFILHHLCR